MKALSSCQQSASSRGHGARLLSAIIVFTIIGLAVAGCGAPRVVKIGLIAPFEGPSRLFGYSALYAVRLRLQEWNEAGGAPRVELVALNDDGDPTLAAALPAQLTIDPDVLLLLGPLQSHTARAALPALVKSGLPTLSLAPLPAHPPSTIFPFAGTAAALQSTLASHAPQVAPAWNTPLAGPTIWLGDPLTLAELRRTTPDLVPAAGPVAAEPAFAAWAGAAANGLIWAAATPAELPDDFATRYEQMAGAPPTPIAALAYAATDAALRLLAAHRTRSDLGAALANLHTPPLRVYQRTADFCCSPVEP